MPDNQTASDLRLAYQQARTAPNAPHLLLAAAEIDRLQDALHRAAAALMAIAGDHSAHFLPDVELAACRDIASEALADLRLGASASVLVNRDMLSVLAEAASDSADYFGELAKETDPEETEAAADYRTIAEERGQAADAARRILGYTPVVVSPLS
jgi:hypothetical protein